MSIFVSCGKVDAVEHRGREPAMVAYGCRAEEKVRAALARVVRRRAQRFVSRGNSRDCGGSRAGVEHRRAEALALVAERLVVLLSGEEPQPLEPRLLRASRRRQLRPRRLRFEHEMRRVEIFSVGRVRRLLRRSLGGGAHGTLERAHLPRGGGPRPQARLAHDASAPAAPLHLRRKHHRPRRRRPRAHGALRESLVEPSPDALPTRPAHLHQKNHRVRQVFLALMLHKGARVRARSFSLLSRDWLGQHRRIRTSEQQLPQYLAPVPPGRKRRERDAPGPV
mmetsp:Transcript_26816/g.87997  ORF Transcript_26816/g.87997 Transcript_26816/m.87997 type:complete len:280 (+) Transcript_26816:493-1332(+)